MFIFQVVGSAECDMMHCVAVRCSAFRKNVCTHSREFEGVSVQGVLPKATSHRSEIRMSGGTGGTFCTLGTVA